MVGQFPSHSATHVTGRLKELTESQNQQLYISDHMFQEAILNYTNKNTTFNSHFNAILFKISPFHEKFIVPATDFSKRAE